MKRRNFIGGVLSSIALIGTILKGKADEIKVAKTDQEDFYDFFYKFNGFPISETQKMFYGWYNNDCGIVTMGRQVGVSTFLITLAAWEGSRGKRVMHILANEHKRQIAADKLWNNRNGIDYKGVALGISRLHGGEDAKNHDIVLYDNEYYNDDTMYTKYNELKGPKKFMLVTQENKKELSFASLAHNLQ